MPNVTINIDVYCARCGRGLCHQTESTITKNQPSFLIDVEPCEYCLDLSYNEGYRKGYDERDEVESI